MTNKDHLAAAQAWRMAEFTEVSGEVAELLRDRLLRVVASPLSRCTKCSEVYIDTLESTDVLNERRVDCDSCGSAGRRRLWEPAPPEKAISIFYVPNANTLDLLEFKSQAVTSCGFHILSGLCDGCYAPEAEDDGIPFCIGLDGQVDADGCWVELYKLSKASE